MEKKLSQETENFLESLLYNIKKEITMTNGSMKGTPKSEEIIRLTCLHFAGQYIEGYAKMCGASDRIKFDK